MNLLQSVPGISRVKAMSLALHYPSPAHLLDALNDTSIPIETRASLLSDKLNDGKIKNNLGEREEGEGREKGQMKCKKLSKLLFTIFTTPTSTTSLSST